MIGKSKSLAPEPHFTAYLFVQHKAILTLRMWIRYEEKISFDQIHDLMDAIHNISELLYAYKGWHVHENVVHDLQRYDAKWSQEGNNPRICLVELLDDAMADVMANGKITSP